MDEVFTGKKGGGNRRGAQMPRFLCNHSYKSLMPNDLYWRIIDPIKFAINKGGIAIGYDATILPDICAIILQARNEKKLKDQSQAIMTEIVLKTLAKVGIIHEYIIL